MSDNHRECLRCGHAWIPRQSSSHSCPRCRTSKWDSRRPTTQERFWAKVNKDGPNGCWLWTAAYCLSSGDNKYGTFKLAGRRVAPHRFAYESLVGPVPEGLELDHLCRNTLCVNPQHLEAVTHRVNIGRGLKAVPGIRSRQTACIHGHPFDEENTYHWGGWRHCRACGNERHKRSYRENRRKK